MRNKGQGVVEYAGALVIAALLVALALTLDSQGLANIFSVVQNKAIEIITSAAEGL